MTHLVVYSAADHRDIRLDTRDFATIARELAANGGRIERWEASHPLKPGASPEDILAAYNAEIDRLKAERGYLDADVVSIKPGNPNWPALRPKFLAEHTHDDDEVRYFVEGSGAFYLHIGDRVLQIVGEAGDLLSVPKGVSHWFDGGEVGDFTCIRVFTSKEGWIAHYTGDAIAESFPRYDKAA
jgi:1,2-dihydroxy-3-keto-5-methylthiopentene dioxygenase